MRLDLFGMSEAVDSELILNRNEYASTRVMFVGIRFCMRYQCNFYCSKRFRRQTLEPPTLKIVASNKCNVCMTRYVLVNIAFLPALIKTNTSRD